MSEMAGIVRQLAQWHRQHGLPIPMVTLSFGNDFAATQAKASLRREVRDLAVVPYDAPTSEITLYGVHLRFVVTKKAAA